MLLTDERDGVVVGVGDGDVVALGDPIARRAYQGKGADEAVLPRVPAPKELENLVNREILVQYLIHLRTRTRIASHL